MSSDLKIEANRRNSKKSTGPRTAAGKAASSRNCIVKTGIYAESEIVRDESAADLEALAAEYHTELNPIGPAERALVDILVHNEWLLRRLRRAEAQLWERNIEATEGSISENRHELGRAVDCDESRVFGRLQRRFDATQRNYQRALKDLQQSQSNRPPRDAALQPQSLPDLPAQPVTLGFAPSFTTPPPADPSLPAPAPSLPPTPTQKRRSEWLTESQQHSNTPNA